MLVQFPEHATPARSQLFCGTPAVYVYGPGAPRRRELRRDDRPLLATDLARLNGVRVNAPALAQQFVQEARSAGLGQRGTQGLVLPLDQNTGVEVRARSS